MSRFRYKHQNRVEKEEDEEKKQLRQEGGRWFSDAFQDVASGPRNSGRLQALQISDPV